MQQSKHRDGNQESDIVDKLIESTPTSLLNGIEENRKRALVCLIENQRSIEFGEPNHRNRKFNYSSIGIVLRLFKNNPEMTSILMPNFPYSIPTGFFFKIAYEKHVIGMDSVANATIETTEFLEAFIKKNIDLTKAHILGIGLQYDDEVVIYAEDIEEETW